MNNQFIVASMWRAEYVAHTHSCYHNAVLNHCFYSSDKSERNKSAKEAIKKLAEAGQYSLLPYRLTILQGDTMADVSRTGRARLPMDAQMKATFTAIEDSPYKTYAPYQVQTGLWQVLGYKSYYAGSIGVTGCSGRIDRDNSDLIVVHTTDWRRLEVYVFRGLAGTQKQLDYLPEVMDYLTTKAV